MFTSYNEQNFGYGFLINPFYNQGHRLIAHDGGFWDNDFLQTVIQMMVCLSLFFPIISLSIYACIRISCNILCKDVELPYHHKKVKNNLALYKYFEGDYEGIKIRENNGKLYYNDFDTELFPSQILNFSDQMMIT